jgi:hypothetical protein
VERGEKNGKNRVRWQKICDGPMFYVGTTGNDDDYDDDNSDIACLVAGIAGSNPAEGMDVCLLCLYVVLSCVGRDLCDRLIARPEESYRASNCV